MKIDKAIFGVDNSYFLEFWPIQAKLVKEILGAEPVLFYICDEESDFYNDGYGLVKKIKKVDEVNTGLLACIARMYGTKYFPEEVCLTCDLDMLMISREYFQDQIKDFSENSLVIYSSDAYDLNRPEAKSLFETEPFPFTQEMYNYPYNAAKGKIFDQILDTNCSFEEFVRRHSNYKPGYKYMWMIDEFYFADCVNNKPHNIEVHKLKRGYTTPWIANNRIERHNFPVELEWEGERQNQEKFGIYDTIKLKEGYYYDVNCCRPYSKYKDAIDDVIEIVLERYNLNNIKTVKDYFLEKKQEKSDINEHLDTFVRYAQECETITEMGVRGITSTWAWMMGNPKKLVGIDFYPPEKFGGDLNEVYRLAQENNINFEFRLENTLECNIEKCDLLFIDTWHDYTQLKKELFRHHNQVNKYIILHDTEFFAFKDESLYEDYTSERIENNLPKGLLSSILEFCMHHPQWYIYEKFANNNGITILKRNEKNSPYKHIL